MGRRSRVCGLTKDVHTAFVTDTNGVAVVVATMCSLLPERTSLVDLSVARDVIVIADVAVTTCQMVLATLPESVALVYSRGRTVEDDKCDGTHGGNLQFTELQFTIYVLYLIANYIYYLTSAKIVHFSK